MKLNDAQYDLETNIGGRGVFEITITITKSHRLKKIQFSKTKF